MFYDYIIGIRKEREHNTVSKLGWSATATRWFITIFAKLSEPN